MYKQARAHIYTGKSEQVEVSRASGYFNNGFIRSFFVKLRVCLSVLFTVPVRFAVSPTPSSSSAQVNV